MESTAHWPQDIGAVKPMDQASSKPPNNNLIERRTRPQKDQALNCPRCNSTNTKFCYYNNYSLTQPRYFCKTCRRYWTEGGSLRNVPVGGGSRKNKRSSSSSSSTTSSSSSSLPLSSASKKLADHHHHHTVPIPPSLNFLPAHQNPKLIHQGQDLNLAYPPTSTHHHDHQDYHHDHHNGISRSPYVEVPYSATTPSTTDNHDQNKSHHQNPSSTTTTTSAMELLKSGINYNASRNHGLISSFMSMPVHGSNTLFSTGFLNLAQDQFKPSLSFGLDHGYNNNHHGDQSYDHGNLDHRGPVQETGGARLLFPSDQDLKQVASTTTTTTNSSDHHRHQFELNKGQGDMSNGYNWNGMLGHGGSW